jgi:beta-lactamase class A
MKKCVLCFLVLLTFVSSVFSQGLNDTTLRRQIAQVAKQVKGVTGVSVLNLETGDTVSYNGKARLVLQSVMKFPIALTVLHWVDTGKLQLTQVIHITRRDLPKDTYSPLRDKFPKGTDMQLSDVLTYMVSESDNNACDILLGLLGGPKTVQAYLLQLGIRGIAVRTSEADMAASWDLQFVNWSKPVEMTALLKMFYTGKILTQPLTDTLTRMMTQTTTGPQRLKGLLPVGTVVAHKTGSSGTQGGITPATNDVGIITLPNGKHIIISVFICNAGGDDAAREGAIAKIARATYDFYNR